MTILFDATTFANPATGFGHGILPAPVARGLAAWLARQDAEDAAWHAARRKLAEDCEAATDRAVFGPARPFEPSPDDRSEAAAMFAELERANREADMEMSYMASAWDDRASGFPAVEDEMLAVGACG